VRAEAESDKDWDARRDLVLVSWRWYANNMGKRKCSKRTGHEGLAGWGRRAAAASGLNED